MLNDTTFRSTSLLLLSLLILAPFQLFLPTLSVFAFSTPSIITDSPLSQKVFKSRCSQLYAIKLSKKSINKKQKFKGTNNVKKQAGNSLNEEEIRQYLTSKFNNQCWEAISNETQSADHQLGSTKRLDKLPALILNADYQPLGVLPLSVSPWQETIKFVFSGRVQVVDVYPDVLVRSVNVEIPLPSVVVLNQYVSIPYNYPTFTRRNLYLRDGYRCQYCGNLYRTNDLSIDHVVPRSRGGQLEWTNIVTACRKCNTKKANTSLNDLHKKGMKLVKLPVVPSNHDIAAMSNTMIPNKVHASWKPFLRMETT